MIFFIAKKNIFMKNRFIKRRDSFVFNPPPPSENRAVHRTNTTSKTPDYKMIKLRLKEYRQLINDIVKLDFRQIQIESHACIITSQRFDLE